MDYAARRADPVRISGIVHRSIPPQTVSPARRTDTRAERSGDALKASRDKSDFLASMSHEMRTPLNTIIGMTEVLEGTEITSEQSQYLKICHASGDALIGLINDIVDISRIEAGELHLDHVAFDLYELVDHLADAMALTAHRKAPRIDVQRNQGTATKLIGDPMRLRQVCTNLLVNAIKFTDKGQVVMRVETDASSREAGVLRFCFADTGIGIARGTEADLFTLRPDRVSARWSKGKWTRTGDIKTSG